MPSLISIRRNARPFNGIASRNSEHRQEADQQRRQRVQPQGAINEAPTPRIQTSRRR